MLMTGRVLAVRVGRPELLRTAAAPVLSAYRKTPVSGPVPLGQGGLAGDEQADRRRHGGPEKAVCIYPSEHYHYHYHYWHRVLGRRLHPGAFGENLAIAGLHEHDVYLGDTFALGSAVVQVSMPRRPCFKIGLVHGRRDLPLLVQSTGRTGFYVRVLEPGQIAADDSLLLLDRPASAESVAEVNRVVNVDKHDLRAARRLVECEHLPHRWRDTLERRLRGSADEDDTARLLGEVSRLTDPARADRQSG
jgi:MOSC domain-containing protein YiiM